MICCPNTTTLVCDYDVCKGNFNTALTAMQDGTHTITVNSHTASALEVELLSGDAIVVPNEFLIEQGEMILQITQPDGTMLNNTCYKITTKFYFKKCTEQSQMQAQ